MKRQKIMQGIRIAMQQTYGSTERDDSLDLVEQQFHLSSGQLKAAGLGGVKTDYWNR